MPVTYCGTIAVVKSLRKLGAPDKIRVCREAIRRVKEAGNGDGGDGGDGSGAQSTEDAKFFGRYLDDDQIFASRRSVAICTSPKGGVSLIQLGGAGHGEPVAGARDGYDSMSMITGGLGETYSYFCYITRERSGARLCRVFQSTNQSDNILVELGDFALERYMMLKKSKGGVSPTETDEAVMGQLEVMKEVTAAIPTTTAFPGTYKFAPAYVDEDDDK